MSETKLSPSAATTAAPEMTKPEDVKIATDATAGTTKKRRRGITNDTRSTSNLKYTEADATRQGLFVGVLAEATVAWAKYGDDVKSSPSFAGQSVPRVNLHFTSIHATPAERRHVFLTLNPVESSVETMEGGSKSWQVDNIFRTLKHVLEVLYLKGRQLTEEEEEALCLPFVDCDEDGTYIPVDAEEVLAGYRYVFENFVAMLNGTFGAGATGKPCFKDANGQPVRLFMKLLRYTKRGNKGWQPVDGRNGDLAFPSFINEGIIEVMKKADEPAKILHINVITESITPKKVEEAKAPSMPANLPGAMPGFAGVAMGGSEVPAYPTDNGYAETASDMPF